MSIPKQILLSLVVIVVAALGWFVFQHRDLILGAAATGDATPGAPKASGPAVAQAKPVAARPASLIPVVATAVDVANNGERLTAIGTLTAAQEVTLYPQVTGIVTEIDFKPGGPVEKGQTLLRLDSKDQEVALERARVALDDARTALDRAQKLAATHNLADAELQVAQVAERKADIDVRVAQLDLDKRTITAPFSGTIGLTDLSVGDLVTSTKAIATLDDVSFLTVDFQSPERFAARLAVDGPLAATAESLPGKVFEGKIFAIDNRIDEATRSLKLKASFPNQNGVLKPGMAVTVGIDFPGEPHPVVPSLAVQWDRDGAFVWKVAGGVVRRTGVTILDRYGRSVSVIAELQKDDRVVVEGVQRLHDGSKVALVGEDGAPDASAVQSGVTPAPAADDIARKGPAPEVKPAGKEPS